MYLITLLVYTKEKSELAGGDARLMLLLGPQVRMTWRRQEKFVNCLGNVRGLEVHCHGSFSERREQLCLAINSTEIPNEVPHFLRNLIGQIGVENLNLYRLVLIGRNESIFPKSFQMYYRSDLREADRNPPFRWMSLELPVCHTAQTRNKPNREEGARLQLQQSLWLESRWNSHGKSSVMYWLYSITSDKTSKFL